MSVSGAFLILIPLQERHTDMTPVDLSFTILFYINLVMVAIVTVSFVPQFLFYLFFWLKRRHFKPSTPQKRFAILICAHNEEAVIERTIRHLLEKMNYPKDLYKVYVCAHNCTDRTVEKARKAGAVVYEYYDDDPEHIMVSYSMRYALRRLLKEEKDIDAFIRADADNLFHPDYLRKMNDALVEGCKIVRGYEGSSNLKQNLWTQQSAIFYYKDSRVQNTFRQAINSTAMATSPGLTFTRDVAEGMDGWDCMTACEDAEFCFRRLEDGYKVYFNTDAIVYEDQPSSFKDTFNRLIRLGHSLNRLFFTDGWRMVKMFFKTGKPMYLDMLLQIAFNPVSVICFIWFPLYYIAYAICMLMQMAGVHVFSFAYFEQTAAGTIDYGIADTFARLSNCGTQSMIDLLVMAVQVILSLYLFCVIQSFLAVYLDRRKNGLDDRLSGMWKGILLSPLFTFVYGICNCIGCVTRLRWTIAKRNPSATRILPQREEKEKKIWYFTISEKEKARYARMVEKTMEKRIAVSTKR